MYNSKLTHMHVICLVCFCGKVLCDLLGCDWGQERLNALSINTHTNTTDIKQKHTDTHQCIQHPMCEEGRQRENTIAKQHSGKKTEKKTPKKYIVCVVDVSSAVP